jgi:hypothetical protein
MTNTTTRTEWYTVARLENGSLSSVLVEIDIRREIPLDTEDRVLRRAIDAFGRDVIPVSGFRPKWTDESTAAAALPRLPLAVHLPPR